MGSSKSDEEASGAGSRYRGLGCGQVMLVPSVGYAKEQRVKRVIEQEEKERRDQSRLLAEEKLKPSRHIHSAPTAQTEVKSDDTTSSSSSPPSRATASTIPVFQQDDSDSQNGASKHNFPFNDGTIDPSQIGRRPSYDTGASPWGLGYDKTTIFGLQPPTRSVPYSNYNFVDAGYLNQLSHIDVKYLTEKGCLTLPSDSLLEEFFHQYFSHIHPIIPLLSEAEFWAADARIPLLLIRAILFISSPYVSASTLLSLGYSSVQAAHTELYTLAKTMTQFDIHRNNVVNAQVAVMLTYHSPAPSDMTNTYWMVNAVHFARCARADQYYTLSDDNPTKLILKRLWWSCILRDRVMSLSLRRPLNIGCDEFDFSLPGLNLADFSDELGVSTVYDRPTRQILAHMMSAFCELIIPLNKALTILYPAAGPKIVTSDADIQKESDACVETLQLLDVWFRKTRERFEISTPSIGVHKSLTMFTKMTFIYYYPGHASDAQKNDLQVQAEMDSALKGITGVFMHLARLGLVQYLPNTFVTFSAIPLIWQVLDAKILNTGTLAADNKRDLMVYTNVMNKFRSLHENANNVLKFIKQIIAHIQTTESVEIAQQEQLTDTCFPPELLSSFPPGGKMQEMDKGPKNKWAQLFAGSPRTYLRIALTIQHSLSSGHFPSEEDFPKALQMVKFAEETMDNGVDVGLYKYLQHMEDFLLSA
ncbi:hypothetical protein TrVFT333_007584 [Trichoderma virens FT-333]|nr:hypothetical protein TrVFT333_007584 [Trichoderma virens FT-333]